MKNILLGAAMSLGLATTAHAGGNPVISGVPVVITTSITLLPGILPSDAPLAGSAPVFFVITPPAGLGGAFTFRLVSPNVRIVQSRLLR